MGVFFDLVVILDEGEFGFEAGEGGLFFGELILSFFDEGGGGFGGVVGVGEASFESVDFATEGEDVVFEVLFVLF